MAARTLDRKSHTGESRGEGWEEQGDPGKEGSDLADKTGGFPDQLQLPAEGDGGPLESSPVYDNSGFILGEKGEREREKRRGRGDEGEAGSLLTWRVNALWGPGMGSFRAGAGTDKHTVSFSVVRAAGDCKSRNVPEPLPSTVGQCQVKASHRRGGRPAPQAFPPTMQGHPCRRTLQ